MRFVTKTQSAFLLPLDIAILEILWYSYWLKGDERMAKNRVIPFGYCMKSGEITVDFTESKAVVRIFEEYLNGSSLLQISKLYRRRQANRLIEKPKDILKIRKDLG